MDRVRPLKIENSMEGTQDDAPFYTELDSTEDYVDAKGITFEGSNGHRIDRAGDGQLQFSDPVNGTKTLADLSQAGSGITESQHKALDYLGHDIAETSYYEPVYDGTYIWRKSVETWWTNSGKTVKVREIVYTYVEIWKYATITVKQYDPAGGLLATLTGTVTYSGNFQTSTQWVLT